MEVKFVPVKYNNKLSALCNLDTEVIMALFNWLILTFPRLIEEIPFYKENEN